MLNLGLIAALAATTFAQIGRPAARAAPVVPAPDPPPPIAADRAKHLALRVVTTDVKEPVGIVPAPGGAYVIEKAGRIRLLRRDRFEATPLLDLRGKVSLEKRENGEQGLLGLALHPRFSRNGRFFINYTDLEGNTRVEQWQRTASGTASKTRDLLRVNQPYANHNAGHLAFGPDGLLYVLLGDGGAADDPQGNAQNPRSLLGKALTIDVDANSVTPAIVARGMRNPWRYTFDPVTGDLYIADVGQNVWEWIHVIPKGRLVGQNLGWNITEGRYCFNGRPCDTAALTKPVLQYAHSEGCSITGGIVYRGKALPELTGLYFYSDYCTALLRAFRFSGGKVHDHHDWKHALDPESKLARISAFGEDENGEMLIASHDGVIYKLVRK